MADFAQPSSGRQWSAGHRAEARQRGLDGIDTSRVAEDERLLSPNKARLPYGQPQPAAGMKTDQLRRLIGDSEAITHNLRLHLQALESRWRGPEIDHACGALSHAIVLSEAAKGELLKIHGQINYQLGR